MSFLDERRELALRRVLSAIGADTWAGSMRGTTDRIDIVTSWSRMG